MSEHDDERSDRRERPDDHLACAITALSQSICCLSEQNKLQLEWFKSHFALATLHDLKQMEKNIMSVISDFAAKQKTFNDRQAAAIDQSVASVAGLVTDIKSLNDKITELQNSSGGVTPEDQGLINELETAGDALASKAEAAAAALKALDDQSPPVVPPVPV